MALQDLKELHEELRKRIQEDAGGFRKYFSNRQVHVISINTKAIIDQSLIEMAAREGYKSPKEFKENVSAGAYNDLMTILNTEVPIFTQNMLTALQDLRKKKNTWIIEFDTNKPSAHNFVVTLSKEKGGEVFQAFKRDVKADAQRDFIKKLNLWSTKMGPGGKGHSRRGTDTGNAEIDKTIGSKTGRKQQPASKEIRTKTKNKDTGKMEGSNDPFLDVGHAEGSAVGGSRKIATDDFLKNYSGAERKKNIAALVHEQLSLDVDSATTWNDELKKELHATFEASSLNKATMGEAKKEVDFLDKRIMAIINKVAQEIYGGWENWESSDSFLDMVEKRTVGELIKPLKNNKNVVVKSRLRTERQKNSKSKVPSKPIKPKRRVKQNPAYKRVAVAKAARATANKTAIKKAGTRTAAGAPLHLIGMINKNLPDVVEGNMGPPRLESQTGRFASSPRVTDIAMTPQGFPSIGYTYQRSPYETFELGGRQGSADYDPRRLIDQSIREIAAQFAMGRFYTRRV